MKRHLQGTSLQKKQYPPVNRTPCKTNIPPLYGNSEEFPESAIFEKGIPEEFPSAFPRSFPSAFPRSGIDGNSSGIPCSYIAFSGNSKELPYRGIIGFTGGFLDIQGESTF
jgi:hypothetical protein